MSVLMSKKEKAMARNFFNSVLHLSFSDFDTYIGDLFDKENEMAISYISNMMTNFVDFDRLFPPDKVFGRLYTITEHLLNGGTKIIMY